MSAPCPDIPPLDIPSTDLGFPDPGQALESLPLPVACFDASGRWASLNEAAEQWLNLSSTGVRGLAPEDRALIARLRTRPGLGALVAQAAAADKPVLHPAVRFETSDRADRWTVRQAALHLRALPGGGVVVAILPAAGDDAAMPRRAARSAIGMAEMLAHEIRNPLSGIRGAAQLLAGGLPPEDRELAGLIVAESRRIVALLDEVERFGDTSAPRLQAVNIHDILERARRSILLGRGGLLGQGGTGLRIVTDYDPSLPPALADPDRLMQVVLNLLQNAVQALAGGLAEPPRGTIRLRTAWDGALRGEGGTALPIQVEVEDDGPGIPPRIADQVFEPFVSGRENGTGLGLALAGKIITDHGGLIRAESRPGRTVLRVSLPQAGREGG